MADRRAAPVERRGPEKTATWPRLYLWRFIRVAGQAGTKRPGVFSKMAGPWPGWNSGSIPISATSTTPHNCRPGISKWPGLRQWKVTVRSAATAPPDRPVRPSSPLGRSTARIRQPAAAAASSASRGAPDNVPRKPAPNRASITSLAGCGRNPANGPASPCQQAAARAASVPGRGGSSAKTRAGMPAADSRRAAT